MRGRSTVEHAKHGIASVSGQRKSVRREKKGNYIVKSLGQREAR